MRRFCRIGWLKMQLTPSLIHNLFRCWLASYSAFSSPARHNATRHAGDRESISNLQVVNRNNYLRYLNQSFFVIWINHDFGKFVVVVFFCWRRRPYFGDSSWIKETAIPFERRRRGCAMLHDSSASWNKWIANCLQGTYRIVNCILICTPKKRRESSMRQGKKIRHFIPHFFHGPFFSVSTHVTCLSSQSNANQKRLFLLQRTQHNWK